MQDSDIRRKRAFYRACHRGAKELDWLLGRFAAAELETMPGQDLDAFEELLAQPDPNIDEWLMKGAQPPSNVAPMIGRIRRFHRIGT